MVDFTNEREEALTSFLDDVVRRRDEIEKLGRLPSDFVPTMKALGLYRALVPRALGGDERTPGEFLALVERIAAADGSVGWVASFAGSALYLAGLPPHRFDELYAGGPDVAFAAGLFPVQPATRDRDTVILNGRWKFASGCSGADWLGVGISVSDSDSASPKPRVIIFPKALAETVEDWSVMGLEGTGSYDLVLRDVPVALDWSFVRGGGTKRSEPIYHFPVIPYSALNHAIVAVGVARAAISEAVAAPAHRSDVNPSGLADARVRLLAARELIYRQTDLVWQFVKRGEQPPAMALSTLRLSANHATEMAVSACKIAIGLVDPDHSDAYPSVERHLRDALVVGQHAFLSHSAYNSAGQMIFGMDAPPGYI